MSEPLPTFDEFVDVLRERLAAADALKPGELHDFHELMSDYSDKVSESWYEDAFDELEALGHLDSESGKAMGPTMGGRLSASGGTYVRRQQEEGKGAPEEEDD